MTSSQTIGGASGDDLVLPFAAEGLDVRGRVVRLGPAVDAILSRHAYPPPVARLLGEALALTALLGAALKHDGRLILQAQGDGPVSMIVVDYDAPGALRGCATYDAGRLERFGGEADSSAALIGKGHLAMTIDRGPDSNRYQGIVALDGESLAAAADLYFRQSEQIPTLVRLAVAQTVTPAPDGGATSWRAGGIIIQHVPPAAAGAAPDAGADAPGGGGEEGAGIAEIEAWREARALTETVEAHELTDPLLAPETLLLRLFHERGVRVFTPQDLTESCTCSHEGSRDLLRRFSREDRADMVDEAGRITVTCHFCSACYSFDPAEFEDAAGKR
ncbi:MAG: Hsp33 family molecular chaperone [Rhodobiaceae bacterium]|nr:Hsp33 family molecular chaperone [Rhodobiaceae bacterium]